jgi:hypothetical protein
MVVSSEFYRTKCEAVNQKTIESKCCHFSDVVDTSEGVAKPEDVLTTEVRLKIN